MRAIAAGSSRETSCGDMFEGEVDRLPNRVISSKLTTNLMLTATLRIVFNGQRQNEGFSHPR